MYQFQAGNFKVNNFDLIRLFAALQVAIQHTLSHLRVDTDTIFIKILGLLPGVPIFFFVSGFLISRSYENNSTLKEYIQNRILRIYPALILCTILSVLSVYSTGYFSGQGIRVSSFVSWIIGQISFVQFYNPSFMRAFGTGVLNGSLWTITVELQFYLLVPILYTLLGLTNYEKSNKKLLLIILLFLLINLLSFELIQLYGKTFLLKLWTVSFAPWIYMFLVGVFFQRNYELFYNWLSGRFLYLLPIFLATSYFLKSQLGWRIGNEINPILFLLLAVLMFSSAYSLPSLGKSSLMGNDISYGIYIYHIPIVNLFIYYNLISNSYYLTIALIITVVCAIFSWVFIEKKCLKFKKRPLFSVG